MALNFKMITGEKKMADDVDVPRTAAVQRQKRPEQIQAEVEAGLANMAELRQDRDHALDERDRALDLVKKASSTIEQLREEVSALKSRVTIYQIERDEAVTKHGVLQGFFQSMQAQYIAFGIKQPAPKQTVASDAEAPRVTPLQEARVPTHQEVMAKVQRNIGLEKL